MTAVDPSSVNVPRVTIPASAVEALADDIGSIASGIETTVVAGARFGKLRDVQRQLRRLVDNALWPAAERPDEGDDWCRDENCTWRNWRSGSMPTHRRGKDCPAPVPVSDEAEAEQAAWLKWIHGDGASRLAHYATDSCRETFLAGFRAARQEDA